VLLIIVNGDILVFVHVGYVPFQSWAKEYFISVQETDERGKILYFKQKE
jgi:hypothetical protein